MFAKPVQSTHIRVAMSDIIINNKFKYKSIHCNQNAVIQFVKNFTTSSSALSTTLANVLFRATHTTQNQKAQHLQLQQILSHPKQRRQNKRQANSCKRE